MYHMTSGTDLSELYTYQASILHAKAYRNLKQIKNEALKPHNLTMMQWLVVGLINDAREEGARTSGIAEQLDTTQAFVTTTVNILESRGFVVRDADVTDKRAKIVKISSKHQNLIEDIERDVREKLRGTLYAKVTRKDLAVFIKVLTAFSGTSDRR